MNSQLIDHLLSAYDDGNHDITDYHSIIDDDNDALFDMIVRGDKHMIASRLAVIEEEMSEDNYSNRVKASKNDINQLSDNEDDAGLSNMLDDDENSNFRLSSYVDESPNYESQIQGVILEIDKFLDEASEKKSVLRYSRAKQLAFDRVEVEYQKMLIVMVILT